MVSFVHWHDVCRQWKNSIADLWKNREVIFFSPPDALPPPRVWIFSHESSDCEWNQKSKKALLCCCWIFFYSSSYFIDMIDVILKLTIRHEDKHLEIPTTSTSTSSAQGCQGCQTCWMCCLTKKMTQTITIPSLENIRDENLGYKIDEAYKFVLNWEEEGWVEKAFKRAAAEEKQWHEMHHWEWNIWYGDMADNSLFLIMHLLCHFNYSMNAKIGMTSQLQNLYIFVTQSHVKET